MHMQLKLHKAKLDVIKCTACGSHYVYVCMYVCNIVMSCHIILCLFVLLLLAYTQRHYMY